VFYSTYLGGTKDDEGAALVLTSNDDLIIAGHTTSEDFPPADPIQAGLAGEADIFVARISADGSARLFGTYLGGEEGESVGGLALDPMGGIVVGGTTQSITYPTTAGAFQEEFVGEINGCEIPFGLVFDCDDMFVTKLQEDGGGLEFSTFVGYTTSADFPPVGIDTASEIVVPCWRPMGVTCSIW